MTTFIEGRGIIFVLHSARNLPDIRHLGHMKVYARISLNEIPETYRVTQVDEEGGTNPTWKCAGIYTVNEVAVQVPGANLVVKLMCKRCLGDKLIGEVKIPLKNLFDSPHESDEILSYEVEGTPKGVLNILCCFSEKIAVVPDKAPPTPSPSSSGQKLLNGIGLGLSVLGLVGNSN